MTVCESVPQTLTVLRWLLAARTAGHETSRPTKQGGNLSLAPWDQSNGVPRAVAVRAR